MRVFGTYAKWILIAAVALFYVNLAHADDDIPPALYPGDYIKAKVRVHLDSRVVSFTESLLTSDMDKQGETFDVYPQKVLRVKALGGEMLWVVPKNKNGIADKLYFLFDNGRTIKELFYPHAYDKWNKAFLFDVNDDGTDDFVIQYVHKDRFSVDVYSVSKDTSVRTSIAEIFSTPYMDSPKQKGVASLSVKEGKVYVRYEYRGKERTAEIRVNQADSTREPYLYPIGVSK